MKSSSSSVPPLKQPFPLLLTKRCQRLNHRQTVDNDKRKCDAPSYLILIQHSISLQHRVDRNAVTKDRENYARAKVMAPDEIATRASCGLLFIRESFHRLSQAHGGSVILLSLAGTMCYDGNSNSTRLFREHGVTVDASADPLGWDDSSTTAPPDVMVQQMRKGGNTLIHARLDNLNELIRAIDRAALYIHNTCETSSKRNNIPIIIDSITPLVAFHGPHHTLNFLEKIRRRHWTSATNIMLSPIIAPILKECALPVHHRLFEDSVADAIVSLDGAKAIIVRKSITSGKITKEEQPFTLSSSASLLHVLNFGEEPSTSSFISADPVVQDNGLSFSASAIPLNIEDSTSRLNGPISQVPKQKKQSVVLRHEDDVQKHSIQHQMPRIFMQDDDVEFQDLDEDEPDDDLDL